MDFVVWRDRADANLEAAIHHTPPKDENPESMPLNYQLTTHLATEVGNVRTNNEDSLAQDASLGLLVLADGMGGYNAGEVASAITTATILQIMRAQLPKIASGERDPATGYRRESALLKSAVETAHQAVLSRASIDPSCAGMGTTVVALLVHRGLVTIAYVGDSRAYRYRGGGLVQITRDHSLLEELVASGQYSREDASKLVRKNIVTRALGVEPEINVDIIEEPAQIGDLYLLCSDGLTDMTSDEQIQQIMEIRGFKLELLSRALVNLALQGGGKDNISVALARIEPGLPSNRPLLQKLKDWF